VPFPQRNEFYYTDFEMESQRFSPENIPKTLRIRRKPDMARVFSAPARNRI
jgi:hypothetical protein